MKILVIEDDLQMLNNIVQSLEQESYIVESATDYESAMLKARAYDYDCILLDISLPGGSGLEVLKELKRDEKSDGIIIVSAKDSIDDKITGLNLGADDYLPKPFHMSELHARVKSVLRRRRFNGNKMITIGNMSIDPDNRTVSVDKDILDLNRKEFDILLYLYTNKGRLVSKPALAEHVWGDHIDEADSFEFIYSQIKNLRKKLKDHKAPVNIKAVYGMGYKLDLI